MGSAEKQLLAYSFISSPSACLCLYRGVCARACACVIVSVSVCVLYAATVVNKSLRQYCGFRLLFALLYLQ